MGIPSYYRFLCQKNKKTITNEYKKTNRTVLCLDFNCIVYNCLSKVPTYENDELYETLLIKEVCKYVEHIWRSAGKPEELLIAVDGVVPMAKMKQQRLRRFKSIFMEPYELEAGVKVVGQKSWDKNSITPGTLFMKKLDFALQELCNSHSCWTLSGFRNYGEGEHKVMNFIRNYNRKGTETETEAETETTFLVYGLDADLILLSMLNSFNNTIFLMREVMEFNSVVLDTFDKETFLYLDIEELKKQLFKNPTKEYIEDYIMMMSLLGNDFLPHSISLTIKDGGYVILYNLLRKFHIQNKFLVKDGKVNWNILKGFIGEFYQSEESFIEQMCKKKKHSFAYKGKTEYEQKMSSVYTLPTKWYVESEIYDGNIIQGWQETYYSKWLHNDKDKILFEYCKGLQWILDYYNGNEIEFDWYYPYMYTPLWCDLYNYIDSANEEIKYTINKPIEPEEQLALVLPVSSYHLITNQKYKSFPTRYPHLFPIKFGVHSLGKKFIYECESNIPIFSSRFFRKIHLKNNILYEIDG